MRTNSILYAPMNVFNTRITHASCSKCWNKICTTFWSKTNLVLYLWSTFALFCNKCLRRYWNWRLVFFLENCFNNSDTSRLSLHENTHSRIMNALRYVMFILRVRSWMKYYQFSTLYVNSSWKFFHQTQKFYSSCWRIWSMVPLYRRVKCFENISSKAQKIPVVCFNQNCWESGENNFQSKHISL